MRQLTKENKFSSYNDLALWKLVQLISCCSFLEFWFLAIQQLRGGEKKH